MSRTGKYYKTAVELYNGSTTHNTDSHLLTTSHKQPVLNLKYETVNTTNTNEPDVWGPALWFSLHNGANTYPIKASKIVSEKMKGFILGLPYIIPCSECSEHAKAHIHSQRRNLDTICSGRDNLFTFFVNFHNFVNRRYGKPEMSVEEAYALYSNGARITKLSY